MFEAVKQWLIRVIIHYNWILHLPKEQSDSNIHKKELIILKFYFTKMGWN